MIRAFIGIPLPEEVRTRLTAVQGELKLLLPRHSTAWTRPENLHLTLRFLGSVPPARIPELSGRLSRALAGFGELELACERLGCFPDLRYPRVIWAWVHDDADRLSRLFRQIDDAVSEFAEKPAEKTLTGHITLARPKQIERPDVERLARFVEGSVERQFGIWTAHSVSLIQSHLSKTGASYTELKCVALR